MAGAVVAVSSLAGWAGLAVPAHAETAGKTTVGASRSVLSAERKRASRYTLPTAARLTQLSVYLEPTSVSGQQTIVGIVYADSAGAPAGLVASTAALTFSSTQSAGWYQLAFPGSPEVAAGSYWIGLLSGPTDGVGGYRYDKVTASRAFNQNTFSSGPSNPFGSFSTDEQLMSLYVTYTPVTTPVNTTAPAITGTAAQGQTLTASTGSWSGSPSAYAYQWQRCDAQGGACAPIALATTSTYTVVEADVNSTLRVAVVASNAAGESAPASSAPTAVVSGAEHVPTNLTPPTITGTALVGRTLTAKTGSWTGSPTSYTYRWKRCNSAGKECKSITGATASTYLLGEADAAKTLRVTVTASNGAGSSKAVTSAPTEVVAGQEAVATFGKTGVGALSDHGMYADYKIVHAATLPRSGSLTKLSLYAIPGSASPSPQALRAVIYADSGGAPGALLATGSEVTYKGDVNGSGWLDLPLPAPVALSAGNYWIGFITGSATLGMGYRYDSVAGSRAYNTNTFTSGPTNPFGQATIDAEQASIYATYTYVAGAAPVNTAPPTITGTPQQGSTLGASTGSWTNGPESFAYQWQRCDAQGESCSNVAGASTRGYTLTEADVGKTLRVRVSAANGGGESGPATSAATSSVSSWAGISHLEYVLTDGVIYVYDIDHEQKLVKTVALSQLQAGVRGMDVYPPSHTLFICYGGDGGPFGTGSVLAYDLVAEKVTWSVNLNTGIDSCAVSPDGTRLYVPTGENDPSGIWNVLDTSNGALVGTIQGGAQAHNTIASADGRYVYLGGRNYNELDVYDTATGKVREVGPLVAGVRPFTIDARNTVAFTTATGFDGFQVSSLITNKVLFTVSFGEVPAEFPASSPSHGASLSPDERQLYVIDAVHKRVQVWNVAGVGEGVAPTKLGSIPVAGLLNGSESPCAYECQKGGWLQHTLDGRYVYVGDSGEVIETATRKVITTLSTLANTKKSIEVDWQGGVPVATGGRTGVGHAE